MGFFKRESNQPTDYNDPSLDDGSWIGGAEDRFGSLIANHYGSPDAIAAGGDQRIQLSDPACALYFYQKAIDTLHSFCAAGPTTPVRVPGTGSLPRATSRSSIGTWRHSEMSANGALARR